MRIYRAIFAWKAFSGYHLWRVGIRAKPRQAWAKATFHAGRTDTAQQALGMIAQALEGIGLDAVREDPLLSWACVRQAIKTPADTRRHGEGLSAWAEWPGDKSALAESGRAFQAAWQAEGVRRQAEYEEAIYSSPEFAEFIRADGRGGATARGEEAIRTFQMWATLQSCWSIRAKSKARRFANPPRLPGSSKRPGAAGTMRGTKKPCGPSSDGSSGGRRGGRADNASALSPSPSWRTPAPKTCGHWGFPARRRRTKSKPPAGGWHPGTTPTRAAARRSSSASARLASGLMALGRRQLPALAPRSSRNRRGAWPFRRPGRPARHEPARPWPWMPHALPGPTRLSGRGHRHQGQATKPYRRTPC